MDGDISPETWRNTGLKANQITAGITQAQIDSIDVAKTSEYGTLTLNGSAVLSTDARYNVDVNVDTGEHDRLEINGALNVHPAFIDISSLTWGSVPSVLSNDDNLPMVAEGIITTTGGIIGANNLRLTAGGALPGDGIADFLQVQGKQNGNNYDLVLGLRWHSNRLDGSGKADAHGDFTVANDFTLNSVLANRSEFSGNPTAHGWQGNTLTKKGAGTLTLNGVNTYTGNTDVQAGTLVVGDAAHTNASVAGNVAVAANATLTGTGRIGGNVTVAPSGWLRGSTTILGNLTLASGATLAGTGTVNGTSTLSGRVTPNESGIGTLTFRNNVTMAGGEYVVDINYANGTRDLLAITGALNVTGATAIQINGTGGMPVGASDTTLPAAISIITTTGGISGDALLTVAGNSVQHPDADFLQMQAGKNGNNYDVGLGLSWHSTVRDAASLAWAHGDFTLQGGDTFTVNGALVNRTAAFTGANNRSGWDGNSLTKKGAGTLVLNGTNTYTGSTNVQAGTLGLNGSVAGGANVSAGATLRGSGSVAGNATVAGLLTDTLAVGGHATVVAGGRVDGNTTIGGNLTLNGGATLAGTGTVNGTSLLSGRVTPNGTGFGTLTFNDNVTMTGATYDVDVNVDTGQRDRLAITGALNVGTPSTINISSLTWNTVPPLWSNDASLPTVAAGIITTGGINNGNNLRVTTGGALPGESADFLQVQGRQNGNDYDLGVGLRWYSNRRNGSGDADAHGDFTVAGDFTLNGVLADRGEFSGNPTAHGWQGNTLTKKGNGTLRLNGVNTYTGTTTVQAGALVVGDANHTNATVAGDVSVAGGARLADRLVINGALAVVSPSTIRINGSGWFGAAPTSDSFFPPSYNIIRATGGITGDMTVVAGGNPHHPSADYLQEYVVKTNTGYDLTPGLSWQSTARDASSLAWAHGDFTLQGGDTFTVNNGLSSRTAAFTGANNRSGWDGNSLTKKGAGTLVLNGFNSYLGLTRVDAGTLTLGATGSVQGDVAVQTGATLNGTGTVRGDLTLDTGATLAGTGTVNGTSLLSGRVTPNDTGFGELTFNDNVTMAGATYDLDVDFDASAQDRLIINGALDVATPSTINVASLTFASPPLPQKDDDLYQIAPAIIRTTGGINNADNLSITAGGAPLVNADFLQVQGRQNGNDYDLALGLRWYSNRRDGSGDADAHGDFTVTNDFTLNGVLADRAAFFGTPTAHGWEGNTLTKKGAGTLTLNGVNTYTGDTLVQAGTLLVGDAANPTASIAGNVQVDAGAILSGTGTVQGNATVAGRLQGTGTIEGTVHMLAGSVFAPGFSIGEKRVGELKFDPTSTFEVEINEVGHNDKVKVEVINGSSGTAELNNATLRVINDGSSNPADWDLTKTYTIIETQNGLTGVFGTIDNTLAFLNVTASYDALNAYLNLRRNGSGFGDVCLTGNQCAVGDALDDLENEDLNHAVIKAILPLDADQARRAYNNLSGEIYASNRAALLGDRMLRDTLNQRLRTHGGRLLASAPVQLASVGTPQLDSATLRPDSLRPNASPLWVSTWGINDKLGGDRNAARTNRAGTGLVMGGEQLVGEKLFVGVALGYEAGKTKNGQDRNSRSETKSYSLGAYAATEVRGVDLRGGVAYSYLDLETERNIWVAGLQGQAKAAQRGHKTQLFVEAARTVEVNEAQISPYVGLAQTWLNTSSAREKGSAAALQVASRTDSVTQATLGVRAAYRLPSATPVTLTADLGWARNFGDVQGKTRNRFAGTNARFAIKGTAMAKNTVQIGAGVQANVTRNATVALDYQGQLGSRYKSHAASLQLRVKF